MEKELTILRQYGSKIPLGHAVQADLFQQGRPLPAELKIPRAFLDQIAETGHRVVPEAAVGVGVDALLVTGQVRSGLDQAHAQVAALNDAAGDDVLRGGVRIAHD